MRGKIIPDKQIRQVIRGKLKKKKKASRIVQRDGGVRNQLSPTHPTLKTQSTEDEKREGKLGPAC